MRLDRPAPIAGSNPGPSSLTRLDEDDNLVATAGLDSYYGTIAERWIGVPASEMFSPARALIDGLLT